MRSAYLERLRFRRVLSCGVIAALVGLVYGQTTHFGFLLFDDDVYVVDNAMVNRGFTARGVADAFGFHAANWHPLTWMSHMLDVQFFGLSAGAHHGINVLLHALSALVLVAALSRLTGSFARSAVVGAWFAVHPLNVENVAWVSERKTIWPRCSPSQRCSRMRSGHVVETARAWLSCAERTPLQSWRSRRPLFFHYFCFFSTSGRSVGDEARRSWSRRSLCFSSLRLHRC